MQGPYDFREGPNNNKLTIKDRINLGVTLLTLPACALYWLGLYAVQTDKLSLSKELFARAGGHVTKSLNARQLRALVPIQPLRVLLNGHKRAAKKAKLHNFNGLFGDKTYSARWVHETPGRQPCDPVLIYLHGGGYVLKMAEQLVGSIIWFAQRYAGARVSILVLDYTVTPFEQYPGQLRELVSLYSDLSVQCSNISIMGDSCGCHLALGLMCHSVDPVPGVPQVDASIESFIAFSPWVGVDANVQYKSMTECTRDVIDRKSLLHMQSMFCGPPELKNPRVNYVLEKSATFWQKVLPAKTVVTWGAQEVLRDSIREWVHNTQLDGKLCYEESPGYHDSLVFGTDLPSTAFVCGHLDEWWGHVPAPGYKSEKAAL